VSNTIAVPVFEGGRVVATVGLTFIASALRPEEAVKNHLAQVKELSLEISNRLTRLKAISEGGRELSASVAQGQATALPN